MIDLRNLLRVKTDVIKIVKPYKCGSLEVKRDTITDEISVYYAEIEGSNMYKIIIRAVNIENRDDIIRYEIINWPGRRHFFNGFLDGFNEEENELYNFRDTCYKLTGNALGSDVFLSKKDVLKFKERFQERISEAKFNGLYEINYKKNYVGKRVFEGRKYFVTYSNGDEFFLDSFGDESPIKLDYDILDSRYDTPYQIKVIVERGYHFNKCKYTPNALRQIIQDCERKMSEEVR